MSTNLSSRCVTLHKYVSSVTLQLMSAGAVKQCTDSLSFRERRRLHFKGVVAEVRWYQKDKIVGSHIVSPPSVVTPPQAAVSRYDLRLLSLSTYLVGKSFFDFHTVGLKTVKSDSRQNELNEKMKIRCREMF
jgi:hypothetical protein